MCFLAYNRLQEKPLCRDTKDLAENHKSGIYLPESINVVLRLFPIWTMLLMFAVIFQQPATFFTKQGMTMKRNIGRNLLIPPAMLQSAITVSIIVLMPLYDKVLIPFTRLITRKEKGINVMQRMGIGMVLSIIAMVIAALVEKKRLSISSKLESQSETVPLSIFWLLPQYIILGIADIFTVVGMQEFFYGEVPIRMRTMGIALYSSVFGVGSFMSAFLIWLIEIFTSSGGRQGWFSDDMREARLDKYYWLLALSSTFSLLLYMLLCKYYKSRSELDSESWKWTCLAWWENCVHELFNLFFFFSSGVWRVLVSENDRFSKCSCFPFFYARSVIFVYKMNEHLGYMISNFVHFAMFNTQEYE